MRNLIFTALFAAVVISVAPAHATEHEKMALDILRETTTVLKSVQDTVTADAAAVPISELAKRAAVLSVPKSTSPEIEAEAGEVMAVFLPEMQRIGDEKCYLSTKLIESLKEFMDALNKSQGKSNEPTEADPNDANIIKLGALCEEATVLLKTVTTEEIGNKVAPQILEIAAKIGKVKIAGDGSEAVTAHSLRQIEAMGEEVQRAVKVGSKPLAEALKILGDTLQKFGD